MRTPWRFIRISSPLKPVMQSVFAGPVVRFSGFFFDPKLVCGYHLILFIIKGFVFADNLNWLVVYLPLWKIWKSVGMIIPNIWKKIPNHQSVYNYDCLFSTRFEQRHFRGLSLSRPPPQIRCKVTSFFWRVWRSGTNPRVSWLAKQTQIKKTHQEL